MQTDEFVVSGKDMTFITRGRTAGPDRLKQYAGRPATRRGGEPCLD